jgi:hypothetical protein
MTNLLNFISNSQLLAIKAGVSGEESKFFRDKLKEMSTVVATMPQTYDQDGKGQEAIAYLHYFTGGCDWYITEKDKGAEDDKQRGKQYQAFGLAKIHEAELGYISIQELIENQVELDLYWTPKTLGEIQS